MKRRGWIVAGIIASIAGVAVAQDVQVETLVEGQSYRAGPLTMSLVDDAPACGASDNGYVWLKHDSQMLEVPTLKAFQPEVTALATRFEADCREIHTLWIRMNSSADNAPYDAVNETENWQPISARPDRQTSNVLTQAVVSQSDTIRALAPTPNHGLRDFGFHNSVLIGKGPGFSLYHGVAQQTYGESQIVVLHTPASDNAPFFDIRENGTSGRRTYGPEFTSSLARLFEENGIKTRMYQRISHYVSGYHKPTEDRVKVMGPNYSEPPHFTTQLPTYWDNGEIRLSPYGASIVNIPFRTRAEMIAFWGPSAPADPGDPAAVPDFGELPPEAPGSEYTAAQATLRDAALKRGLIYRNDAYWAEFSAYDTRHIFESWAGPRYTGGIARSTILMRYLTVNSQKCASSIKDPVAFKLDEITTTTGPYGSSTSTDTLYDITVPRRFKAELERRFGNNENPSAGAVLGAALGAMQPGGLNRLAGQYRKDKDWMERSIADVDRIMAEGDCGNPMQVQLEEMLYYMTSEQPASETKLSFRNAAALSDPLYVPGNAPSLRAACLLEGEFNQSTDTRSIRWCECVATKIRQRAPDRVETYTKRYKQFGRDMQVAQTFIDRRQDHPDVSFHREYRSCSGIP